MSDQENSFISPIKKEVAEHIEQLDLSTLEKLHLKLLVHCYEIFKNISSESNLVFPTEKHLEDWCNLEVQRINDKNFSHLLFQQMSAALKKIKDYAKTIGKEPLSLKLEDLISLIQKN